MIRKSNRTTRYYHQLLAAVVCSPAHKTVLPIAFEPIIASDGQAKDCCEASAAARLIPSLHCQYPKLSRRFVVNEDALSANGPHVKLLSEHGMDFIIVAKPAAMNSLFKDFDARRAAPDSDVVEFEWTDDKGVIRGVRFANGLSINASHRTTKVNLLEFWEVTRPGMPKEKTVNWSWITSIAAICKLVVRSFYAATDSFSAVATSGFSGFSHTTAGRSQSRVAPLQRDGLRRFA